MTVASADAGRAPGARTRRASAVTSISAGGLERGPGDGRARRGPEPVGRQPALVVPSGQPSQAWAADSTKVSQSRSMRLSRACVPGPRIGSQPRTRATEQDQAADALRMPRRPGDRVGHRVVEAEQHDRGRRRPPRPPHRDRARCASSDRSVTSRWLRPVPRPSYWISRTRRRAARTRAAGPGSATPPRSWRAGRRADGGAPARAHAAVQAIRVPSAAVANSIPVCTWASVPRRSRAG